MRLRKEIEGISPGVHGGRVVEVAEQTGAGEAELLDLSSNLNPLPPPDAKAVYYSALSKLGRYPDNRYKTFVNAAAKFAGVKPENIVPGNGSNELIRLFTECAVERGDVALIPFPAFDEYERACLLFGAKIKHIPYKKITGLGGADLKNVKLLFLCNPNNPTGELIEREQVKALAELCSQSGTFLFVDEVFIELADPDHSIAAYACNSDHVFVLRSLTKTFAVPGLRVGYGVASSALARKLNNARLTWNLSVVGEGLGVFFLEKSGDYLERSRALIGKEREFLFEQLSAIPGLLPWRSRVNFMLIDISGTTLGSKELARRLLGHKIIVRDCSSFKSLGNAYIRIAIRSREENIRFIKALRQILG